MKYKMNQYANKKKEESIFNYEFAHELGAIIEDHKNKHKKNKDVARCKMNEKTKEKPE